MKNRIMRALLLFAVAGLFSGCATPVQPMKWEYHVYTCPGELEINDPNPGLLGKQGWKLVSAVYNSDTKQTECIFERRVR
jgi:hypothetical protein